MLSQIVYIFLDNIANSIDRNEFYYYNKQRIWRVQSLV